jgi:hypothetical protein
VILLTEHGKLLDYLSVGRHCILLGVARATLYAADAGLLADCCIGENDNR